jgi:hypothetical protein
VVHSLIDATDRPYSYVFVTTKAIPEVTTTPDLLRPLLSKPYADHYPQPTYVLVQNGLNVERDLYNALIELDKGTPSIISTSLYVGANLLAPNVVEHNHFVGSIQLETSCHPDTPYPCRIDSPLECTVTMTILLRRIRFRKLHYLKTLVTF